MNILYIEVNKETKRPLTTSEQSKQPFYDSTDIIEASLEDIQKAKEYYTLNNKCEFHLVYDEKDAYCGYHARYCGICNSFIALI